MSIKIASMKFGDCDTILHNTPNGMKNIAEVLGPNGEVYWTSTKELTGVPPLSIRSNGTPLLDYLISGNMSQTGTPTPTTPIQPQGTGERTGNLLPSPVAATKSNNGITVRSDGAGRYYVSGTAENDAYITFNIQPFLIPNSTVIAGGNGTFSIFNTKTYPNDAVKLELYYQGTFIDNWGLTKLNRTSINYSAMANKTTDVVGIFVKNGTTVDFQISPEFTNDGVLPVNYEPYGYKIPISSGGVNLFDKTANYHVGRTSYNYTISGLDPDKYYTCSTNFERISGVGTASLYFNGGISLDNGVWSDTPRTFKPNYNGEIIVYIRYKADAGAPVIYDDVMAGTIWVMVNEGSTALPYEPYNHTATPVYLGEVESTRRIKKLVLDGTENWLVLDVYYTVPAPNVRPWVGCVCTHCAYQGIIGGNDNMRLWVKQASFPNHQTLEDFKSYLAAQYAAGTPVTVWYVLATEETAVVNEPIRKIGDYADTLSMEQAGVQIPTLHGNTVIDVETTLKPSQMYIKYK